MKNKPSAYVLEQAAGDPGLRDTGDRETVIRMIRESQMAKKLPQKSSIKETFELLAPTGSPSEGGKSDDGSSAEAANALSSVINFIITDAFNLTPEESLWVAYYLGEILSPLKNIEPALLLAAVDNELKTGEYSKRMMKKISDTNNIPYQAVTVSQNFNSGVKYAPVSDWVEGISEIILSSYPNLRPMIRSSIVGSIHGLFLELGVHDNPRQSRASLYLPNSVRFILEAGRDES